MGHAAVSAIRPKMKYCNFATFNRILDTKTSIIQKEPNI